MNRSSRSNAYTFFAFCLGFLASSVAWTATAAPPDHAQIETDQKTGTVNFIIDGKTIVRIDGKGVHVTGDIDYSGTTTDTNGIVPGQ